VDKQFKYATAKKDKFNGFNNISGTIVVVLIGLRYLDHPAMGDRFSLE